MKTPIITNEDAIRAWAFDHSTNSTVITNTKHEILTANKAFLESFGFTREEIIGKHAVKVLETRSVGVELLERIPEYLDKYGEWKGEVINVRKNGDEIPCLLTITSIFSPDGAKIGYLGVDIDLTVRKQLEAQIARCENLANIGESVSILMHEVRNPLNGMAMNVCMLEDSLERGGSWTAEDRMSINLISSEIKRLENLTTNALSYARKVEIHSERQPVVNFIHSIEELLGSSLSENGVKLLIELQSDNLYGYFDADLMKQVLLNLLINAIEAASNSDERFVRIWVDVNADPKWSAMCPSGQVLRFCIDNTGMPISESHSKQLFKPFFTSKQKGVGLGLAVSAKIVRQHHGIIEHEQIDDRPYSTRFIITLPN